MLSTAHVSFTVEDLDRSLGFYGDVLGMELVSTMERVGDDISQMVAFPNAHLKIAFMKLPGPGGMLLELIEYLSPRGRPVNLGTCDPGSAHICFEVEDIQSVYKELYARHVRFKSEPVEISTGLNAGGYAVYFLDPDDFTLELLQPPQPRTRGANG